MIIKDMELLLDMELLQAHQSTGASILQLQQLC